MMKNRRWRRAAMGVLFASGMLYGGPCGVTTLQWQDFVSTTLIRTGITTAVSILEVAIIQGQQGGG